MELNNFTQLFYNSDLKSYGYTEDGEEYIGEQYYVGLEDKRGNRWRHHVFYDGVRVITDEDGIGFADTRPEAMESCRRFIDLIRRTGEVNLQYWIQDRPVYGSSAYMDYGQEDDIEWEKERRYR